jgi:hypothetical protein
MYFNHACMLYVALQKVEKFPHTRKKKRPDDDPEIKKGPNMLSYTN